MGKWTKPNINTKFHIDFEWWEKQEGNFRLHLYSNLCPQCQATYKSYAEAADIDWIDPETGEVIRVDGLWQSLRTHCSQLPEYITPQTPLTTSIFRTFLANNNTPLTPVELCTILGRKTPEIILRTIGGRRIYNGIKPVPPGEENK